MDLVVALYGESLQWLLDVPPEYNIHVMNMGLPAIPDGPRSYELHVIQDAGFESWAYANYILFNWDKLPEWMVMVQANPFDHAAAATDPGVAPNFIERLKQLPALMAEPALFFIPIGNFNKCSIDEPLPFKQARMFPRSPKVIYNVTVGEGTNGEEVLTPSCPLRDVYGYLFRPTEDIPAETTWSWGNMFAVRREPVVALGWEFWKRLSEILEHAPKPIEGAALERLWPSIILEGSKRANRAV